MTYVGIPYYVLRMYMHIVSMHVPYYVLSMEIHIVIPMHVPYYVLPV